jgi:hypothetical protein
VANTEKKHNQKNIGLLWCTDSPFSTWSPKTVHTEHTTYKENGKTKDGKVNMKHKPVNATLKEKTMFIWNSQISKLICYMKVKI